MDTATKDTMVNSPLPMIIFRPESDDIIWTNDRFLQLTGQGQREHMFDAKLASLIPGFDTRWLMEGKSECPTEVEYGGRRFWVFGHLVRTGGRGGGFLATTYWVDITEFCLIRDKFNASRPVAAVLLIDNYEDLMKNLTENERSSILAEIDNRLDEWVAQTGGLLRRYQHFEHLLALAQILRRADHIGLCLLGTKRAAHALQRAALQIKLLLQICDLLGRALRNRLLLVQL